MQTFTLTFTKGCKNVPHSCFKSDYWVGRRYIVLSLFGHSGTRFDSAVQRLTQLVNIWARVHGRVFTLGFVFASVLYHNGSVCDSFYVCFVNIVIKAYERLLRGFLMYLQHGKKSQIISDCPFVSPRDQGLSDHVFKDVSQCLCYHINVWLIRKKTKKKKGPATDIFERPFDQSMDFLPGF